MANAILIAMTTIVSIDRAGRIVLPKPLRDQFNLHPGSQLTIAPGSDHLELKPVESSSAMAREDGLWVHQGMAQVNLSAAVNQLREERLGGLSSKSKALRRASTSLSSENFPRTAWREGPYMMSCC